MALAELLGDDMRYVVCVLFAAIRRCYLPLCTLYCLFDWSGFCFDVLLF